MISQLQQLRRSLRRLAPIAAIPLLGGCNMVVLDPAGDVARQQADLVIFSTLLMLVIIVPVMALVVWFAWRYRASNTQATYEPDWDHSTAVELGIWAAPLLIIITLGAVTWVGTHLLDPYRSLARTGPGKPIAADVRPLEVQVVALDWKWLFIYPEQGIATVNEFAAPEGRPIRFRISSSSVMNSFYIPALAGQIYAMPAMETKLHAVFDKTGSYIGFSANYSGAGFSNMRFKALSLAPKDFDAWVAEARGAGGSLDRNAYLQLERPSEKEPVRRWASVDPTLFDAVVNLCVDPSKMCMHDMAMIDARGGMGEAGKWNVSALSYDKFGARGTLPPGKGRFVTAVCTTKDFPAIGKDLAAPANLAPLSGAGLPRPGEPVPALADGARPSRPNS
ncbi:ubiquinol oxidase subunit II [Sphingomonas sp.]|uniref:ubiquinol oxidase subunit II n=1 Tax=Sphingomonas sp. TaxID=28214 RepID=UPI001B1ABB8D|nr:ubiquinol oxidase subunit II [Sphingomonas sp.]MBO9715108.1 ubiquinol oxidase subunit II [Sphingomonas sp.]